MVRSEAPGARLPKLLTPAGGMILSVVISGCLWSVLVVGAHVAGLF